MKKFIKQITNLFRFILAYLKIQDHNRKVDRAINKPEVKKSIDKKYQGKKFGRTIGEKIYDGLKALGYTKRIVSTSGDLFKPDPEPSQYRLFMMNQHKLRYSEKHEGLKVIRSEKKNKHGFFTLSKA